MVGTAEKKKKELLRALEDVEMKFGDHNQDRLERLKKECQDFYSRVEREVFTRESLAAMIDMRKEEIVVSKKKITRLRGDIKKEVLKVKAENDDYLFLKTSKEEKKKDANTCLLYTSPSPRDRQKSRMPSSA
eukprot:TRINITY_DN7179_c0_g1_i1.p2 TRINITY_DN7179_c0_g1~~TRINITY_DN7179_c0_g1_i1.p2  ORF type:complete len:132 (+),score=36.35 TRINITY_DN7179_c0_g1_i1:731-1126(+)